MKIKLLAISAITAIIITSCKWFGSEPVNQLTGTWKLDSIAPGNDSSELGLVLLAIAMQKDSVELKVTKDTMYFTGEEPIAYSVNKDLSEMVLKDSANTKYNIPFINDSLLQLKSADSVQLFFTRKNSH